MTQIFRCLLFVAVIGVTFSSRGAEKEPGGHGALKNQLDTCFKTGSGTVVRVCAKYTINWKLWSLMGEPVGDYNLAWQLTSIDLMDPERKLIARFTPETLPSELRKAASVIELYIDGVATVSIVGKCKIDYNFLTERPVNPCGWEAFHHFNTGTAVRAGAGSSLNVPGSPNWDTLFAANAFLACDDKQVTNLDAKTAKDKFVRGIKLSDLRICPRSSVSELTALESAVGSLCEAPGADKKYTFCSKQKPENKKAAGSNSNDPAPGLGASVLDGTSGTSSLRSKEVHSLLDENAERPAIQKRLSQEIIKYRLAAEPGCRSKMRDVDACYTKTGCSRPAESPSEERCKEIPPYPNGYVVNTLVLTRIPSQGEICYREDAECRAARLELAEERRENARSAGEAARSRQIEWTSRYGDVSEECKKRSKEREVFSSCKKQFDAACNPKGFVSSDDCVNDLVRTKGPTEYDARKLMEKDWEQRATTGSSITNSILD